MSDNTGRILNRISIKPIGDFSVVDTISKLIKEHKLPYKGLAIVDGDKINECTNCDIGLPGQKAPEKQVIEDLKAINWQNLDNRFGIGAGSLFRVFQKAILEPDHHDWTTYIGDNIKQSKSYVWSVMVEEWCKQCLSVDERGRIYNAIVEALNS
jgi:hypothetical protein